MREFIAADAGGTSTRAVLVDETGRCLGFGRAPGGNPTGHGVADAAAAVAAAMASALGARDGSRVGTVLLAHAGARSPEYLDGIAAGLAGRGVAAPITGAGDLQALFASGTHEVDGAAVIAGTGAIGGVIRDGRLHRLVDGTGWLLGDAGAGFWIGHRVARAVTDHLDGGPATALTAALLDRLDLRDDGTAVDGRPRVLVELIHALYAWRPVRLAELAPLAFAHADDPIAASILRESVGALTALLHRLRRFQADGPLVFGGGVLVEGILRDGNGLAAPLLEAAAPAVPIPVTDGLVGAAVLALRAGGVTVDADRFAVVAAGIEAAR